MTTKDWDKWKEFREIGSGRITGQEVTYICEQHAKYFLHKLKMPCSCRNSTRRAFIQKYIEDLNKLWHTKPPVRGGTIINGEGLAFVDFENADGNAKNR